MLWPNDAEKAISDAFYDKDIEVLRAEVSYDEEGGIINRPATVQYTFKGNAKYTNLGKVQAELGLVKAIDICITCKITEEVFLTDLIRVNGEIYNVTSVIPSDSHLTIIGNKHEG